MTVDEDVSEKIRTKHSLTKNEVDEAILAGAHRTAVWHDHPVYGRRLLVRGLTYASHEILAVLKPIDEADGTWELKTARRLT